MRAYLWLGVALMLAGAAPQEDKVEQEHKKLAGRWILDSAEVDGKPVAREHVEKSEIQHSEGQCVLKTPHQSPEPIKAKIKVDPSKTPKQMVFVRSEGPNAGKDILAIYEFVGDDTYRVCFDPTGVGRPEEFDTVPGSGHILHVWKRPKK